MPYHALTLRRHARLNGTVADLEGTIQFAYNLEAPTGPLLDAAQFADLAAWRSILHRLQLIGQYADRYEGLAYGNLSVRPMDDETFVITASQTSGAQLLLADDLVRVQHANLQRFWIDAEGAQPPSSEAITHAMIYHCDRRVKAIMHIHNPVIWQQRAALRLPETGADVPYGSAAMASAVAELLAAHVSRPLVFASAGHRDGIFALGHSHRDCAGVLINCLARAETLTAMEA